MSGYNVELGESLKINLPVLLPDVLSGWSNDQGTGKDKSTLTFNLGCNLFTNLGLL